MENQNRKFNWPNYTEQQYWHLRRELDREINRAHRQQRKFQDIISGKGKTSASLDKLIHEHFGICGASFTIADKVNNQLLYYYGTDNQDIDNSDELPFVSIPYKWAIIDQSIAAKDYEQKYYRLIDAFNIQVRDQQKIIDEDKISPDFYRHICYLEEGTNEAIERDKLLLPFEKELARDYKLIYCTTGEILFYTYAWRLLHKIVSERGFAEDSVLTSEYESFGQSKQFDFWTQIKSNFPNYVGLQWLEGIRRRSIKKKGMTEALDELLIEVDGQEKITLEYLYNLLGLSREGLVTPELQSLIDYCIHIARSYLGWTYENTRQKLFLYSHDLVEGELTKEGMLFYLEQAFSDIDERFQRNAEIDHSFDRLEKAKLPSLMDFNEKYAIDQCIQRVIKEFLIEIGEGSNAKSTTLKRAFLKVHEKVRFPILPYFYILAIGEFHHPKEHLVYCAWNSMDHPVEIGVGNGRIVNEPGVAFVHLTIFPIWKLNNRLNFIRNRKRIHLYPHLSEENYTRLFRIFSLLSSMIKPVVDKIFYNNLIKKNIRTESEDDFMEAFEHEVSKITNNIFTQSNTTLQKLFPENLKELTAFLRKYIPIEGEYQEIIDPSSWLIIPNSNRFLSWEKYLTLWGGRNRVPILDMKNHSLREILEKCLEYSGQIYVSGQMNGMQGFEKGIDKVIKYEKDFRERLKSTISQKKINIQINGEDSLKLKSAKGNVIGKEKDEQLHLYNSFIRLMIAIFTNTYEHSISESTLLLTYDENFTNLSLVNLFDPLVSLELDPSKSHLGTKQVLRYCIKALDGQILSFKRENTDEWPGANKWSTKLEFKTESIFEII